MDTGETVYDFVVEVLAEQLGPVAQLIAEDALHASHLEVDKLNHSRVFLVFLKAVKLELPPDIDRQTTYDLIWHRALRRFDFH